MRIIEVLKCLSCVCIIWLWSLWCRSWEGYLYPFKVCSSREGKARFCSQWTSGRGFILQITRTLPCNQLFTCFDALTPPTSCFAKHLETCRVLVKVVNIPWHSCFQNFPKLVAFSFCSVVCGILAVYVLQGCSWKRIKGTVAVMPTEIWGSMILSCAGNWKVCKACMCPWFSTSSCSDQGYPTGQGNFHLI